MKIHLAFISACCALSGCASIKSSPIVGATTEPPPDGLVYYLPRKDFLVAITVSDDKGAISAVKLDTTPAYPDTTKPFAFAYQRNWVSKNETTITVDINGLLKTTKAEITSGAAATAQIVGEIAAFRVLRNQQDAGKPSTCPKGEHTFIIRTLPVPVGENTPCGVNIEIEPMMATDYSAQDKVDASLTTGYSGVYYRTARPYLMRASGAFRAAAIVYSPNDAPVRKLPIERALFTDGSVDFTFSEGMPTQYKQTADGEVLAFLKLPAVVLSAYFKAVGDLFTNFKKRDDSQVGALDASLKLELVKFKHTACIEAIKQKNNDLISSLECDK